MAWPIVDTTTRVAFGGIRAAGHADDNNLSGGSGAGRTFVGGSIMSERIMQDGLVRQVKYRLHSATGSGNIKFKVFRLSAGTYTMISESETIAASGAGNKTADLSSPMACQPGDIMGIYLAASGALIACKTATGTATIKSDLEADITTTSTFAELDVDNLSLCIDYLGQEPIACCTGDSIIGGHNLSATTTAHWRTLLDTDGPSGVLSAEPFHQMRGKFLGSLDFQYQNFARGAQEWSWVNSTGMPRCVALAKGPIVAAAGVNDINNGTTWASILSSLAGIKAQLTGQQRLFIPEILPWTAGSDANAATLRTFNVNLRDWCSDNNATLIRTWRAMGKLRVSTGFNDDLLAAYDFDGVHLTQAGVDAYAALITSALDVYYHGAGRAPRLRPAPFKPGVGPNYVNRLLV